MNLRKYQRGYLGDQEDAFDSWITARCAGADRETLNLLAAGATSILDEGGSYSAQRIKVDKIDSTSYIIVFSLSSNNHLTAVIASVNVDTGAVTYGTPATVRAAAAGFFDVTVLSSTKVLVTHGDANPANALATVLTISGSTISAVGALNTMFATSSNFNDVETAAYSATEVVLTWRPGTTPCKAVLLSISGDTVTANTPSDIGTSTSVGDVVPISATLAAVFYADGSGDKIVALTLSGTSIVVGTAESLTSMSFDSIATARGHYQTTNGWITVSGRKSTGAVTQALVGVSGATLTLHSGSIYTSTDMTALNGNAVGHATLSGTTSIPVASDSATVYPYSEVNTLGASASSNTTSKALLTSSTVTRIFAVQLSSTRIAWAGVNGNPTGDIISQTINLI